MLVPSSSIQGHIRQLRRPQADEPADVLVLDGCAVSSKVARSIARALARPGNPVRRCSLADNQIGDSGAEALAAALGANARLTALDLSGNSIGAAGAATQSLTVYSLL